MQRDRINIYNQKKYNLKKERDGLNLTDLNYQFGIMVKEIEEIKNKLMVCEMRLNAAGILLKDKD